jgi:hypothetical protein
MGLTAHTVYRPSHKKMQPGGTQSRCSGSPLGDVLLADRRDFLFRLKLLCAVMPSPDSRTGHPPGVLVRFTGPFAPSTKRSTPDTSPEGHCASSLARRCIPDMIVGRSGTPLSRHSHQKRA